MTKKLTISNAEQGSQEWHDLRCGILTASAVKNLITPKKKEIADNFTKTVFFRKKILERLTGITNDCTDDTEPYQNQAMLDGHIEEDWAIKAFSENFEPLEKIGFMHLQDENYQIGFSPDGMGKDFFIECKSRAPHLHIQTMLDLTVPDEFMAQIQAGLFVTGFDYAKFISWPRINETFAERLNLPAVVITVQRDDDYIEKIKLAAIAFEEAITAMTHKLNEIIHTNFLSKDDVAFMPSSKEYTKIINLDDL